MNKKGVSITHIIPRVVEVPWQEHRTKTKFFIMQHTYFRSG